MLNHIKISNFAIIDTLDLDFSPAYTVLTGETGAGKSIIVDALGLALGERADNTMIRTGKDKAEIALDFDISRLPFARQWLAEHDLALDDNNECIIRRIITQEGRSKAYINGSRTPLNQLRQLGGLLVEIHGQHEHQSLLRRETQQQLLDDFAGLTNTCAQLNDIAQQWHQQNQALQTLKSSLHEKQTRSDYLQFQLQELNSLDLQPGEYPQLEEEHRRLSHSETLLRTTQQSLAALDEDDFSVTHTLHQHLNELERLSHLDGELKEACELLGHASLQLSEGVKALHHYANNLEPEPERLQWLEQRISTAHDLSRKHRIPAEQLSELQQTLQQTLDALAVSDEHLAQHEQQLNTLHQQYQTLARKLSTGRRQGAQKLATAIEKIIRPLGLPHGCFEIQLIPTDNKQPPRNGLERIEFLVSTNPGQTPAPLNKVASGGELSRIGLAIQVIAANNTENMTFVFDEVDTGIGGGTAEVVGQQLAQLGESHQVFCVTHLAQVAAQGHHHYNVTKTTDGKSTTTTIRPLKGKNRIEEIARMLGGINITAQTRSHAKEMLGLANTKATTKEKPLKKRA